MHGAHTRIDQNQLALLYKMSMVGGQVSGLSSKDPKIRMNQVVSLNETSATTSKIFDKKIGSAQ